ncbi:DNA adenine methylase [Serratia marcescens]|uniref:DNA adenine methylase n=1 Tax=Serratia marcescens TaxID=615 RepID=UPI0009B2755F|nr:DNA adenine methylase [Serratia marcescens]EKN5095832.1 DNA adenine methylase [Yersinia enterocolitica]EKN5103301.1 DNA adenine methylase [Yersinia enterocolitica]
MTIDATASKRQKRRTDRLKEQRINKTTVLVHEECKPAFEGLRSHLINPVKAEALASLILQLQDKTKPTNVAQVKQLSPFRYPGGKTWLVPEVRKWLTASVNRPSILVEPFAGGAMIGLSAASEELAEHVFLSELDDDVSAVWQAIFHGKEEDVAWLRQTILDFDVNLEKVRTILDGNPQTVRERAFRTIVKNRMQRGGIMAAGAGLIKAGEAGRGLKSRWYPETLARRIEALQSLRENITFEQADAFEVVRRYSHDNKAFFFIDPPYTAGGKKAGSRLYSHNEVDHEGLFSLMSSVAGSVMMTYDNAPEVRELAERYGFRIEEVPMKNTHHVVIRELLLLRP